jgi:hypothetical protein
MDRPCGRLVARFRSKTDCVEKTSILTGSEPAATQHATRRCQGLNRKSQIANDLGLDRGCGWGWEAGIVRRLRGGMD